MTAACVWGGAGKQDERETEEGGERVGLLILLKQAHLNRPISVFPASAANDAGGCFECSLAVRLNCTHVAVATINLQLTCAGHPDKKPSAHVFPSILLHTNDKPQRSGFSNVRQPFRFRQQAPIETAERPRTRTLQGGRPWERGYGRSLCLTVSQSHSHSQSECTSLRVRQSVGSHVHMNECAGSPCVSYTQTWRGPRMLQAAPVFLITARKTL